MGYHIVNENRQNVKWTATLKPIKNNINSVTMNSQFQTLSAEDIEIFPDKNEIGIANVCPTSPVFIFLPNLSLPTGLNCHFEDKGITVPFTTAMNSGSQKACLVSKCLQNNEKQLVFCKIKLASPNNNCIVLKHTQVI